MIWKLLPISIFVLMDSLFLGSSTDSYHTIVENYAGIESFSADLDLDRTATYIGDPVDIKSDTSDNLYLVDKQWHRILKIDSSTNIVTSIAGTIGEGWLEGDGGLAQDSHLKNPNGILIAPTGELYIADTKNHRIRYVTQDGIISSIAGKEQLGVRGFTGDNGPASMAKLTGVRGITGDTNGNIFISTEYSVRRVDGVTGIITTYAGRFDQSATDDSLITDNGVPATSADLG